MESHGNERLTQSDFLDSELIEITRWFEWVNREAMRGTLKVPGSNEQVVLAIVRGLQNAEEVLDTMPLLVPHDVRTFIREAAILHECWAQQKGPSIAFANQLVN